MYVAQLNAAGRAVAANLGLHIVDSAAMSEGFTWQQRLQDCHHPSIMLQEASAHMCCVFFIHPLFLPNVQEVFNIYLNIIDRS